MIFDDDNDNEPRKKPAGQKSLDNMGIAELEDYIGQLKAEISRAEVEIVKKKAIRDRAASVFK